MDHPDTQEPDTKKDATAEPAAQAKEPKEPQEPKEPAAVAKPEKKDDRDDRIAALEAEIASMKAILSARGIGDAYADFLTGDKDTWETQADALAALKGADPAPTTVPRDPAVDGDTTDNDEDLAAAKAFLGID